MTWKEKNGHSIFMLDHDKFIYPETPFFQKCHLSWSSTKLFNYTDTYAVGVCVVYFAVILLK